MNAVAIGVLVQACEPCNVSFAQCVHLSGSEMKAEIEEGEGEDCYLVCPTLCQSIVPIFGEEGENIKS